MVIKGKVLNTTVENREIVDKMGQRRQLKINSVLVMCPDEVVNCKTYDERFELPKAGSEFECRVRKYETHGLTGDVLF